MNNFINRRAIIFGLKGTKLTKSERKLIKSYKPWGIILFARNIKNLEQLKLLINSIKNTIKDAEKFIKSPEPQEEKNSEKKSERKKK